jgi:hypothetical protein
MPKWVGGSGKTVHSLLGLESVGQMVAERWAGLFLLYCYAGVILKKVDTFFFFFFSFFFFFFRGGGGGVGWAFASEIWYVPASRSSIMPCGTRGAYFFFFFSFFPLSFLSFTFQRTGITYGPIFRM